jgi:hypothetical protein
LPLLSSNSSYSWSRFARTPIGAVDAAATDSGDQRAGFLQPGSGQPISGIQRVRDITEDVVSISIGTSQASSDLEMHAAWLRRRLATETSAAVLERRAVAPVTPRSELLPRV